jgi:hypothetical protein
MGSGNLPPSFLYSSRTRRKICARMSWSRRHVGRSGQRCVLPLQPARRIHKRPILLRESRAGQLIHRGVDLLHFLRCRARRLPEGAGLVGIDFAHHQEVGLLQRVDVLLRIRTDHHPVHAEGEDAFHFAFVHVVPVLDPGIVAVHLRQPRKGEIVVLRRRRPIHCLQERHRELRCVRPIVKRLPLARLGWSRGHAIQIGFQVLVRRSGHLQIAGQNVENAGHVGRALNVGVTAQRIDAAAGASHVAHQQLQHGTRCE